MSLNSLRSDTDKQPSGYGSTYAERDALFW